MTIVDLIWIVANVNDGSLDCKHGVRFLTARRNSDIMVLDVLIAAALGGLAGSSIQAVVNRRNVKEQIEAQNTRVTRQLEIQNQRRRMEFYLQKKVQVLTEVHRAMEEAYLSYVNHYDMTAGGDFLTEEEYVEELQPIFEKYESSMYRANLFFEEEDRNKFHDMRNEMMDMNTYLIDDYPSNDYKKSEFIEAYQEARSVLEAEFNEPISQLREGLGPLRQP